MKEKLFVPDNPVYLTDVSSVVGKVEGEGPLGRFFDIVSNDVSFGKRTWEMSESEMQKQAFYKALAKSGMSEDEAELLITGDLTNQCSASHFGFAEAEIPQINVYGACSTLAEELIIGAAAVGAGYAENAVCVTSSHFCTAEKQFRNPLEYGGQKPPTSQRTVTGAGAFILRSERGKGCFARIEHGLVGISRDFGTDDPNNMGAAMAPAAADTLTRYFKITERPPGFFDLIVTGDLGYEGTRLLYRLTDENGIDIKGRHVDCGMAVYDREKQDAHSGGSGCGCSAVVLASYILPMMKENKIKNVLFAATGALLSTNSVQQKRTIPGIAHLVSFVSEDKYGGSD